MFMRSFSLVGLLRSCFAVVLLSFMGVVQAAADIGLLWQVVSPGGTQSYLFGTMHSDDPRITDFSSKLVQAVAESEVFMMETLPTADYSIYFMQDATLRDLLTEDELDQVRKLADFHVMRDDVVMRMKPWLLAMVFDLPKPQTPFSQDMQLLALAESQDKQILGLETAEEHFNALDSLSREEHLTMLRAVLKRTPEEKERDFEQLLDTYLAGNLDQIAAFDEEMTGNILPAELWRKIKTRLLDERNARLAERIMQQADERAIFVAVGASHLAGEEGLLARLRNAGYKVSPL
jgi:uncharacterized protein YbaP (TraB family)